MWKSAEVAFVRSDFKTITVSMEDLAKVILALPRCNARFGNDVGARQGDVVAGKAQSQVRHRCRDLPREPQLCSETQSALSRKKSMHASTISAASTHQR